MKCPEITPIASRREVDERQLFRRRVVQDLPTGLGHWNSPIVTDGRIAVPEGNSNDHRATGVLDIFRLPARG